MHGVRPKIKPFSVIKFARFYYYITDTRRSVKTNDDYATRNIIVLSVNDCRTRQLFRTTYFRTPRTDSVFETFFEFVYDLYSMI